MSRLAAHLFVSAREQVYGVTPKLAGSSGVVTGVARPMYLSTGVVWESQPTQMLPEIAPSDVIAPGSAGKAGVLGIVEARNMGGLCSIAWPGHLQLPFLCQRLGSVQGFPALLFITKHLAHPSQVTEA